MKKNLLLLVFCFLFSNQGWSQIDVRDSVFVKVNEVDPQLFKYGIFKNRINILTFLVKNKYGDVLSFGAGYTDNDLMLKNKQMVTSTRKVITYEKFKEMLEEKFLDVAFYYKVYFILSEDKDDYLTLHVRPILPPELNKQ